MRPPPPRKKDRSKPRRKPTLASLAASAEERRSAVEKADEVERIVAEGIEGGFLPRFRDPRAFGVAFLGLMSALGSPRAAAVSAELSHRMVLDGLREGRPTRRPSLVDDLLRAQGIDNRPEED